MIRPTETPAPRVHPGCESCRCSVCDLCGEPESETGGDPHVVVTLSDGSKWTTCETCREEHLPECTSCGDRYPVADLLPSMAWHQEDHDICPPCGWDYREEVAGEGGVPLEQWPDSEQDAELAAENLTLPPRAGAVR
jgi:hypothetical protein